MATRAVRRMRRKDARDAYAEAIEALWENQIADAAAGRDWETEEFTELNHAATAAEAPLTRIEIWLIDQRVADQMDFWPRYRRAERKGNAIIAERERDGQR